MEKPVRVAHVIGKMVGGGVEAVVMNYYRHINRERVQFDFIIDSDSTVVSAEEIDGLGGRLYEVPPYQHLGEYQKALGGLLAQNSYSIAHSHINTLSVFPLRVAKRASVPVRIAHSHATMGKGEIKRNLIKLILRPFTNAYPTDRVACSRYAGEWLFGKNTDFTVIPNAVELGRFRFDTVSRAEVRAAWGVDDGCCVVGNLGRMESTKNQAFLINAFARMHAAHPDSMLIIAGCGSLREPLEKMACSMGLAESVRFLGQVDDVSHLYQGMDVFVLPSLYEGFGMALLEAQVAGVPSVVSNRVSPEVVLTDSCRLLPLESGTDAWAREIWAQFEGGDRKDAAGKAFEPFDIDNASEKLEAFYLRLYEGVRI
ncbi:glycosyltransferase family 1 protein [Paraeggerthella hongkongensis]|uniref:glycosyltransferase n=1 Tax=Paraeggerthella sp. TaxID=2897350 RepID=UPI000DF845F7|nr:glycosyltransferase family 1 protein [Paraeggerthella hongkongensis]